MLKKYKPRLDQKELHIYSSFLWNKLFIKTIYFLKITSGLKFIEMNISATIEGVQQ